MLAYITGDVQSSARVGAVVVGCIAINLLTVFSNMQYFKLYHYCVVINNDGLTPIVAIFGDDDLWDRTRITSHHTVPIDGSIHHYSLINVPLYEWLSYIYHVKNMCCCYTLNIKFYYVPTHNLK